MATNWSSHYSSAENRANGGVKVAKATQVWTISNFDYVEAEGSIVYSPKFSSSTNDEAKWYIKLYPNGTTDKKDTIGLYLGLHKTSEYKKVLAKFSMFIFNKKDKVAISKHSAEIREFIAGGNPWGWLEFCQKDAKFRGNILSNNELKISCEITFAYRNTLPLKSTAAINDVTKDLGVLLEKNLLADVDIWVKGKNFPAHKAILAARSKVFAAMFQSGTKENAVDIEDLSEEIVGEMLRFIYVGRCEKLDELAVGLLAAADKYNLDQLKIVCSRALCDNLSVENAAENLILANTHNASELKSAVMKFIAAKPSEVFDTAGWRSILSYPNPDLLNEVFRATGARRQMPKPSDKAEPHSKSSFHLFSLCSFFFKKKKK